MQPAAADLAALRAQYRDGKARLLAEFAAAPPRVAATARLVRALTQHVDRTLTTLWQQAGVPAGLALVAVGGYGRAELFPESDVDVLVLRPEACDADEVDEAGGPHRGEAPTREAIERFVTLCWDSGLAIGSSVRSVAECRSEALRDITVQTAVLESRLVCGEPALFQQLVETMDAAMDARAFLRAKTLEMRQRHVKYEGTPYALEPNCKESPGGLRDLHVLIWVARAAGLGRNWSELCAKGLLTPFEARRLRQHEGTLKLIRARLHLVAGRREDRLLFDLQTAVAESFQLCSTDEQHCSERLMHRYYWAAKAVTQLNEIVLLNIEERITGTERAPMQPINERFLDRGGMLEVAHDRLYEEDPHAILETFLVFQQTPGLRGFSARTLRALYNARTLMGASFRRDPRNRELFMQILRQPSGQTHALRQMNATSVLGRYLWVFRRIVGRMQHDLFHVYTVDQHILMVVRNVRRFLIPEHAHEYPLCSQLAAGFDAPWVLYVAALFHDVAKGRRGDHSELGAREARRFCRAHDIQGEDARLIEFLVREHLTMSRVAQKEDLYDPEVIARFAALVGDERTLTALYLLTVADIRGTGPTVWNAWKGKLLEDLYRLALRALGGARPNLQAEIEARRAEARQRLARMGGAPGSEEALWQTLDVGYFARHDADELAWHALELAAHVGSLDPVVRARASAHGQGLQMLFYVRDRPDLFARICGYFDAAGFSIQDARVHTTSDGYALDTFQVVGTRLHEGDDGDADEAAQRALRARMQAQAMRALADERPLREPGRVRVSRRMRSFPVAPSVTLAPDERAQRWLLTVTASDRTGLLYAIARVLARHQVNLQTAKVTTLGERVEDVFLVDGAALQQPRVQLQIESELLDAIGTPT
ncbi:MAG: [protein-PII] uridylyltransferase [Burkholderiales bacterium]|nr:[protein-PII] uridylyltransferase [Burkholderiales bacterium]